MTLRKKLASAAVGAAAAATLVLGVANPANAAGTKSYNAYTTDGCAYVEFDSYGEHFKISDGCFDGYGVAVQFKLGSSGTVYTRFNHNGGYTTVDDDESFAEGAVVYFRACVSTGTTIKYCGAWTYATA
ncbi:hypothetical protein GCM10023205_81870 [Yinghuangia aomiensis]|uniref:Uncharacterized protein n=1 Tax=Yinghuangia aomiensis TaxID=676205 RepID=A0ABP9IGD5_9ACTN